MSILLAVWLAIGPIGWIGVLVGMPVWTVTTSVVLARADRRPRPLAVPRDGAAHASGR